MILSNKKFLYEYHYELSNGVRLRILGNKEISQKCQNFMELETSAHSPPQNEYFVILARGY